MLRNRSVNEQQALAKLITLLKSRKYDATLMEVFSYFDAEKFSALTKITNSPVYEDWGMSPITAAALFCGDERVVRLVLERTLAECPDHLHEVISDPRNPYYGCNAFTLVILRADRPIEKIVRLFVQADTYIAAYSELKETIEKNYNTSKKLMQLCLHK